MGKSQIGHIAKILGKAGRGERPDNKNPFGRHQTVRRSAQSIQVQIIGKFFDVADGGCRLHQGEGRSGPIVVVCDR